MRRPTPTTVGLIYGFSCYGLGGLIPLYLLALAPATTVEVVATRTVFAFLTLLMIIAATRSWRSLALVFRSPRTWGALSLAAALSAAYTMAYMYGIVDGQAIEVSLGSFVAPILSVLLGVLILKERLRPLQWVAVGIGSAAVLLLALPSGRIPWIALLCALPWALYGLVKNRVGIKVNALASFTAESIFLAPIAALVLGSQAVSGTLTLTGFGAGHFALLALGGLVTAVPMLFHGGATRRLSLSTVGLLQFVSPVLLFILAVTVLHEHMGPERWAGFAVVGLSVGVLSLDVLIQARSRRYGISTASKPAAA